MEERAVTSSSATSIPLTLQTCLCSEPIVDYPRRDRPYALIVDAALGDDVHPGGLGAILSQLNLAGEHCVIAYASRKLQKHEKNYTPFCSKCKLQFGVWIIFQHISECATLHSFPITNLSKNWVKYTQEL
jgi:hypothetical protein